MKLYYFILVLIFSSIIFFNCDTTANSSNDETTSGSIPVISLATLDTLYLDSGAIFNEPSYTAADVEDGDLTDSVKVGYYKSDKISTLSKNEITLNVGLSYIKYSLIDSDSNSVVKWVTVIIEMKKTIGDMPIISLEGPDTSFVLNYSEYEEFGFICLDTEDDNLTDSVKIKWYESNKDSLLDIDLITAGDTAFIKYYVIDSDNNYSEAWRCVIFSTQITLTQIVSNKSSVEVGDSVTIQVASAGSDIIYHWKIYLNGSSIGNSEETIENQWSFIANKEGVYTIKVWGTNNVGSSNTLEIDVEVIDNSIEIYANINKTYMQNIGEVIATINTTNSDFKYYFQLDNDSASFSTSNSKTFAINTIGSHSIKVWVKNSNNVISNVVILNVFIGEFPIHRNIKASTFWCGEGSSNENDFITNTNSAWDLHWGERFGLEDHPTNISRDKNHIPTSSKYRKTENPYYFALPYNDYGKLVYDGKNAKVDTAAIDSYWHKKNSYNTVFWADENSVSGWNNKSMCKNRWIKIIDNSSGKVCYAQWEDAGPYYYNDHSYVFGTASPANTTDSPYAGIDLSPSVSLYFGKQMHEWGAGTYDVDWQFVAEGDVPNGPWTIFITTQQVCWE